MLQPLNLHHMFEHTTRVVHYSVAGLVVVTYIMSIVLYRVCI